VRVKSEPLKQYEPKREQAGPGGLSPSSALGLNFETEGERFAMQLFKKLWSCFQKRAAEWRRVGAVFYLDKGVLIL
jgi:hypothetical protein